jgi:hypothetical protein
MTEFVAAGAGFLLAVVWFDLMFDVQVLRHRHRDELPEPVLESIAAYYRRVTTAARPMNRLVGIVMVATLGAAIAQLAGDEAPRWAAIASVALVGLALVVVATRTFPGAVRLATRRDPAEIQTRLARSIWTDHVICLAAMAALLAIQLGFT